ncbi:MAG: hypothetical protein KDD47_24230 [Acidobacteria bacterium]|nr:hypothetical protein [Acidobacteriota bacterium]
MRRFLVSALLSSLITLPAPAAGGASGDGGGVALQPVEAFFSYLSEMLGGLLPAGPSAASCQSTGAGDSEIGPCIEPHGISQGGQGSAASCQSAGAGDSEFGPCIEPNG